jgi:predicted kinase
MYRALVRVKVTAIRLGQPDLDPGEKTAVEREFEQYLALAESYTRVEKSCLVVTCGMSGSGKTTVTGKLLEHLHAIRIRSDVERKRLFGLAPEESGRAPVGEGIYSARAADDTYGRLAELADAGLSAGLRVIVDAAGLEYRQRARFKALAARRHVGFTILEVTAPVAILERRISERTGDASDADLVVLRAQLERWPVLRADEVPLTLRVDTSKALDVDALVAQILGALPPQVDPEDAG